MERKRTGKCGRGKRERDGAVVSRRVICISEICRRRRRSLCSGWPSLVSQSVSQFRQFSHLNYWSFAQHALDRERQREREGDRRSSICGVVVRRRCRAVGSPKWDLRGENNRSNGTTTFGLPGRGSSVSLRLHQRSSRYLLFGGWSRNAMVGQSSAGILI